jgi:hypothetical protein
MILGSQTGWVCISVGFVFILLPFRGLAQGPDQNTTAASSPAAQSPPEAKASENKVDTTGNPEPPGGKRIFGVLPNYRTVDQTQVNGPLTASQKFAIANKDSFDYPLVLLAAGLAGIGQWSNQNPSFGQEGGGFGKRFVTGFTDQALGNIMTEGVFPAILHEDPRYYRRGTGSTWSRTTYALSRLFVTPTDSGNLTFNYSEWGGNATATAISNIYYTDGRTVRANIGKLGFQIGLDGAALVLKEFWPDVERKFFERHQPAGTTH